MAAIPFFLRLIAVASGLGIAQWSSEAVSFSSAPGFVFSVILLTVFLTLLKPLLVLLMLPFVILTLGLGLWVVNALLVKLTSTIIPGFLLADWGGAFWSAFWVSVLAIGAAALTGKQNGQFRRVVVRQNGFRIERPETSERKSKKEDDVIDI